MKLSHLSVLLLSALAVAVLLAACSDPESSTPAPQQQQVVLAFGETKTLTQAQITLTFDALYGPDRRCPDGMQCFSPGLTEIVVVSNRHALPLHLPIYGYLDHNTPPEPLVTPLFVDGYKIALLELTPYPTAVGYIDDTLYKATIEVTPYDTTIAHPTGLLELTTAPSWTYQITEMYETDTTTREQVVEVVDGWTDLQGDWYQLSYHLIDLGYVISVHGDTLGNHQGQAIDPLPGDIYGWFEPMYKPPRDTAYTYGYILEGDLYHFRTVEQTDTAVVVPAGSYTETDRYTGQSLYWSDMTVHIKEGVGIVFMERTTTSMYPIPRHEVWKLVASSVLGK